MRDYETEMLAYVQLAKLSEQRKQRLGRDKFLILAGGAACRAGWPDVAERCREIILKHNRVHLIGEYASFADALRSSTFQPFLRQLERFCPFEHAEYLLSELQIVLNVKSGSEAVSVGEYALQVLTAPYWS